MGKDVKICKFDKMAKNHFSRFDFGSWGGFLVPPKWLKRGVWFTRPMPAFGRQGLDADTRDDSPRACGARRVGGVEWGAPTDLLSNWPLGPNWPFGSKKFYRRQTPTLFLLQLIMKTKMEIQPKMHPSKLIFWVSSHPLTNRSSKAGAPPLSWGFDRKQVSFCETKCAQGGAGWGGSWGSYYVKHPTFPWKPKKGRHMMYSRNTTHICWRKYLQL